MAEEGIGEDEVKASKWTAAPCPVQYNDEALDAEAPGGEALKLMKTMDELAGVRKSEWKKCYVEPGVGTATLKAAQAVHKDALGIVKLRLEVERLLEVRDALKEENAWLVAQIGGH